MEMTPDLNLKIRIRVLSKVLYELTNACGVDCTEDIKKGVLDKQILNEIKLEFLDDEETIRGEIIFLINWEKLEFSAKANEDVSLLKNIDINRLIAPQLDPEVYNSLKLFVDRLKYKQHIKVGSSVYINGCLQTRDVQRKTVCENCGTEYIWSDTAMEIIPYSIEYLNGCDLPEPLERLQDKGENNAQNESYG